MKKITLSIIGLLISFKAYAQELIPCEDGTMANAEVGCSKAPESILSSQSTLLNVILKIANGLVTIAVGGAVIVLIYGAIRYTTSMGNEEKMESAKRTLFWGIFGLILALLAKYIVISIIAMIS